MAADTGPGTYAEAVTAAQDLLRAGHLNDPGEHFPYKHDDVVSLIRAGTVMGPEGEDDDRMTIEDYMSREIADRSRDYVAAQEAYLRSPGVATLGAYDGAREQLVAARQAHRANRTGVTIGGVTRARRTGE